MILGFVTVLLADFLGFIIPREILETRIFLRRNFINSSAFSRYELWGEEIFFIFIYYTAKPELC